MKCSEIGSQANTIYDLYWLRIYPEPFAEAVLRMLDDLKENRTQVHQKLPTPEPCGPEIISSMFRERHRNDQFPQANLAEAFKYIRGGTGLNLPKYWKEIVPSFLPDRENPYKSIAES